VVEGARLESVFTGNRNVGSNPTPSASISIISMSYIEHGNFPTPDPTNRYYGRAHWRTETTCFLVLGRCGWHRLRSGSRPQFAADQASLDARSDSAFKDVPEDVALSETLVAGAGER
jgi:hypothetical protein